ncbi:MAG TPA: DNRLRE domain-containing protein [Panacibacter sp.]|nr:DNRLRE domain-containing protein [Panacibacter sp.]
MAKNITNFLSILSICIAAGFFFSCKKETAVNNFVSSASVNNDASVVLEAVDGATRLTLKPGLTGGQDSYVSKIDNDPNDGNTNLNFTHELVASKFYYYGQLATQRSYIKFDSLIKVPATAKIVSARLYLYGESSSLSFPYGNSYPSAINPPNPCLIQRVTGGNWDQSTITWNNKPETTDKYQDTIPASASEWDYNTSVDVTKMVQLMVKSSVNYGFCIRLVTEEDYRILEFSTSEASNSALRPKLVIVYK